MLEKYDLTKSHPPNHIFPFVVDRQSDPLFLNAKPKSTITAGSTKRRGRPSSSMSQATADKPTQMKKRSGYSQNVIAPKTP
jgi:hypothetical protein